MLIRTFQIDVGDTVRRTVGPVAQNEGVGCLLYTSDAADE